MTKYSLKAEKRTILGSKIKQLRRKGVIPANLFGKGIDSQAIQVSQKDFDKVYKEAGETSVIYVSLEGETKERPALVSAIHFNPVTGQKLHIDFHQVNLKEKVSARVPVELVGELDIIKSGEAILNQSISEIEIEALPTDIPEAIIFDITSLKEIGDHINVSDTKVPEGVTVLTDPEIQVVSLAEPQKEEVVAVEETPEEEITGAVAPEEVKAEEAPTKE